MSESDRKVCKIKGCGAPVYVQRAALCSRHYNRLLRTGTTDDGPKPRAPSHVRFWAKVDRRGPNDCWPWVGNSWTYGYGSFGLPGRRGGKIQSNRMAWILENGEIPEGMVVRHKCHNRACCNPKHLELGARADNVEDMWKRAASAPRGNARISEDDVREIRRKEQSRKELADRFGVTVAHIKAIQLRRCWKRVLD